MGKVLHASGSGYFPGCIQDGTGYWSLEKAMEVYWRVKTWELRTTVTYLVEEGEDSEVLVTYPDSPNPFQPVSIDSSLIQGEEEYLVCEHSLNSIYADIDFYQSTKSGSLYDPGFTFYANWTQEYDFGFAEFQIDSGGGGTDVRSFSIYGSSPIQMSFTLLERPTVSSTLLDATFSLEPKEWFSYGGTYNTSTGEPL